MAKEIEPETKATKTNTPKSNTVTIHRNWAYGVAGVLIILFVLMASVGFARRHEEFKEAVPLGGFKTGLSTRPHHFMMGGGQTNVNTGDRVTGVVTAVDGSSFTLAGFGSTTNVTTNSSTQYQGGNTVKVNDTVAAIGTTSNGILTATQVSINP